MSPTAPNEAARVRIRRLTRAPLWVDVVGPALVADTGDVARIRSPAAFALLAGVAPIPASSGEVHRMRLNRGGNRRLNRAL